MDRIIAGLEKKNRLINDKERTIVAYHEAGHAIVAERVPTADPVHKISIIPRGVAALGYTQQLPTEDRYLLTKQELMDRIAVLLGGRVAEEIVFNEISTGAGNDLERVTELARSMVMEYGMSRELGPVNLAGPRRTQFLQGDGGGPQQRNYSEETAREIDAEIRGLIDGTYERVRKLLTADRAGAGGAGEAAAGKGGGGRGGAARDHGAAAAHARAQRGPRGGDAARHAPGGRRAGRRVVPWTRRWTTRRRTPAARMPLDAARPPEGGRQANQPPKQARLT